MECGSSNDTGIQADFYSGAKGHGHCVQYGNITDLRGYCWCIVPGEYRVQSTEYNRVQSTEYRDC